MVYYLQMVGKKIKHYKILFSYLNFRIILHKRPLLSFGNFLPEYNYEWWYVFI